MGAYGALAPEVIDPAEAWTPSPAPPLTGPLAPNAALTRSRLVARGQLAGPESVAFDASGRLYTGTSDGRVLRVHPETDRVELVARMGRELPSCGQPEMEAECGRPLGLAFDPNGRLFVADAHAGLVEIAEGGEVIPRVTEAGGVRLGFTDDLDIASDGRIYFSDASVKWTRARFREDILENNGNGRLVRFDPATGDVEVLLDGLHFANGVALALDESYVLVVETSRYRIRRYHLTGSLAGTADTFADNLPGFADNLRRGRDGTWWVAMGAKRSPILDFLHPRPALKRVFAKLVPMAKFQEHLIPKVGWALQLGPDGQPVASFWDTEGAYLRELSAVIEHEGRLWLGSITADRIGVLEL